MTRCKNMIIPFIKILGMLTKFSAGTKNDKTMCETYQKLLKASESDSGLSSAP